MPATLEKLDELDELDFEKTPPCEVVWWFITRCGMPSSWRIVSQCPGCRDKSIIFICGDCKNYGNLRGFICNLCRSPRGINGYL